MNKFLKVLLCFCLCLAMSVPILPVLSESKLEIRDTKAYSESVKKPKMDFDLISNIKENTNADEWKFTTPANAIIKDGKLTCKSGASFTIGTGYTLGDDYGLEKSELSFDMVLTEGNIAVGTRLSENAATLKNVGIWFTIYKDKVEVTEVSSKLKETITYTQDLSSEQKFTIEDNISSIVLKTGGTTVCSVMYSIDTLTVQDSSGNVVKSFKNDSTPLAGYAKIAVNKVVGTIDNIEYIHRDVVKTFPESGQRVVDYTTWVATDDLDRTTPDNSTVGNVRDKKYVGLFYFIFSTDSTGGVVRDNTKIYLEKGLDALKAFLPKSFGGHWAEPYFGYYLSTDEWIYRKHAAMLSAAGVDFIYLDMSNMQTYPECNKVLFDTWLKIRKEGGQTPQIVPMCGDMPAIMVSDLYNIWGTIFSKPEYDELLFKWEGKPLILGNNDNPEGDRWTATGSTPQSRDQFYETISKNKKILEFYESGEFEKCLSKLTVRKSWAWQSRYYDKNKDFAGYWDWIDEWPQAPGRSFEGVVEQMPVALGAHANSSQGRSYVNKKADYGTGLEDFDFTLGTAKYGYCFEQQFQRAMEIDPQVIMITGWNEWYSGVATGASKTTITAHTKTPGYSIIDQFNPEFSRDAEPMKIRTGVGFGDNYYYQMVSYIKQYKGTNKMTVASGQKAISLSSNTDMWSDVGPEYRDTLFDTAYRRHLSFGGKYLYINNSGRNDLDFAKVSQDDDYLYFLITTSNDIVTVDESNWMNLLIDINMDNSTGWEGYDYVLNRSRDGSTVSVEKFVDNSWKFEKIADAEYTLGTKSMTIKVSKSSLGLSKGLPSFDFKWADNSTTTGDVMQFMDLGDSAPNDRFNYRYLGTAPKNSNNFFSVIFSPKNWTDAHIISLTVLLCAIISTVVVLKVSPKKRINRDL